MKRASKGAESAKLLSHIGYLEGQGWSEERERVKMMYLRRGTPPERAPKLVEPVILVEPTEIGYVEQPEEEIKVEEIVPD